MFRLRLFARVLGQAVIEAWWNAWCGFWDEVGEGEGDNEYSWTQSDGFEPSGDFS